MKNILWEIMEDNGHKGKDGKLFTNFSSIKANDYFAMQVIYYNVFVFLFIKCARNSIFRKITKSHSMLLQIQYCK